MQAFLLYYIRINNDRQQAWPQFIQDYHKAIGHFMHTKIQVFLKVMEDVHNLAKETSDILFAKLEILPAALPDQGIFIFNSGDSGAIA